MDDSIISHHIGMLNSPIATHPTGDLYRDTRYCPFCGKESFRLQDCTWNSMPDLYNRSFRYYRKGECYERQIRILKMEISGSKMDIKSINEKITAFQKSLKELINHSK